MATQTLKRQSKWSELIVYLENEVMSNLRKPIPERKTLTEIFKEFAERYNTTPQSVSFYYYHEIKPKVDRLINNAEREIKSPNSVYKIGDEVEVTVEAIQDFGVFVTTKEGFKGLIHISEISGREFVTIPEDYFYIGEKVKAKIMRFTADGKISFSTRALGGKEKINRQITEKLQNIAQTKQEQEKHNNHQQERHLVSSDDSSNIIQFIKRYSDNHVSTKALADIDEMIKQYGVFKTTLALIETVRDLDISSFITEMTKERLESEYLRQ